MPARTSPKRGRRGGFWRCSGRKLDLFLNLTTWNCLALGETEADREWKLDFCRSIGYDVLCLTELWNQQLASDDFVVSDIDRNDRQGGRSWIAF